MTHAEARELLELAAVEPEGLDRLAAGDTPEAAAVAAHLAGCASCTDEFERLLRTSVVLRRVISSEPPPEMRERTLAFIRTVGRDRSGVASTGRGVPLDGPMPGLAGRFRTGRFGRPAVWAASLAAAVILSVLGTGVVMNNARNDQQNRETAELVDVVDWAAEIQRAPDAREAILKGSDGTPSGKVLFSPATRDLLVFTSGLTPPPAGKQYRCWLELDGKRTRVGEMAFAAGLAYWFDRNVVTLAQVDRATQFGISLVDVTPSSQEGQTVLTAPL